MKVKILAIFTGIGLFNYAINTQAAGPLVQPRVMVRGFSTYLGEYNEFLTRGYDIQPNRPGVWYKGCRTDNYYCLAKLERCNVFQGGYPRPLYVVPSPPSIEYTEAYRLKDHR